MTAPIPRSHLDTRFQDLETAAMTTPRRWPAWIAPVLICVVALGFRLWYLGEVRGQLDFEQPVVDAGYHDYWAWGMASRMTRS